MLPPHRSNRNDPERYDVLRDLEKDQQQLQPTQPEQIRHDVPSHPASERMEHVQRWMQQRANAQQEKLREQKEAQLQKDGRDKLDREKLQALGYDADNPAVLKHYQELQGKVLTERITRQDALRGLETHSFEIADKERRDAVKQERAAPRHEKGEPAREQPRAEKDATAERVVGREQKDDVQKIDVDRFRSDPDYRREVKAQTAEQLKAERQQRADRPRELERDERQR